MAIDIIEAVPGLELGRGYDFPQNDPKIMQAVKGKVGKIPKAKGQVAAEYNFTVVNSVTDFQTALGVDASVSLNFGLAGGSLKTSFEEKCRVTSEATFCLVSFKAVNAPISLRGDVRLDDDAYRLLEQKDYKRFRQRYGPHFCSDLITGVEFVGSLRLQAETTEQELEVAASINARYGLSKGSVSTNYSESSFSSKCRIEIFTFQTGGIMKPVNSIEELFETGKRVANQGAKGLATPMQVVLGSYDELALPKDGMSDLAQRHTRKEMRRLKKLYDQLRQDLNNIDFILANPEKYVEFDHKHFQKLNKNITESLTHIVTLSDQCASDFENYEAEEPSIPVVELPERKRRSRRNSALKQNNLLLRARNKSQRAKLLAAKASDLPPGQRKARLEKEVEQLKAKAKTFKEKAKALKEQKKVKNQNINKSKPQKGTKARRVKANKKAN